MVRDRRRGGDRIRTCKQARSLHCRCTPTGQSIGQCPRQESNLSLNLRRVACEIHHTPRTERRSTKWWPENPLARFLRAAVALRPRQAERGGSRTRSSRSMYSDRTVEPPVPPPGVEPGLPRFQRGVQPLTPERPSCTPTRGRTWNTDLEDRCDLHFTIGALTIEREARDSNPSSPFGGIVFETSPAIRIRLRSRMSQPTSGNRGSRTRPESSPARLASGCDKPLVT